jgi:hypothetical protein
MRTSVSLYFLPIVLLYGYLELLDKLPFRKPQASDLFNWPDSEVTELLLSLGFLLFVAINKYRQSHQSGRGLGQAVAATSHLKQEQPVGTTDVKQR